MAIREDFKYPVRTTTREREFQINYDIASFIGTVIGIVLMSPIFVIIGLLKLITFGSKFGIVGIILSSFIGCGIV